MTLANILLIVIAALLLMIAIGVGILARIAALLYSRTIGLNLKWLDVELRARRQDQERKKKVYGI